jgi:hypothetical protein
MYTGQSLMESCQDPLQVNTDSFPETEAGTYDFDVSPVSDDAWFRVSQGFELNNIWQNLFYGRPRWGVDRVESCRLTCHGRVHAAAMIAVVQLPVLRVRLAYVQFGPLWPLYDSASDRHVHLEFLEKLRSHYVGEKRMLLWVRPREADSQNRGLTRIFEKAGYVSQPFAFGRGTYRLDLRMPVDEIRAQTSKSWRRNLKRSHQHKLEFASFNDEHGFDTFFKLYDELAERKQLAETPELKAFRAVCRTQPEAAQLEACVCSLHGEPLAAVIISSLGNTGIALMSATSERARELRAGYALDWWCVNKLKHDGLRWYDLSGDQTPGVNEYKAGLVGRGGRIRFAGPFIAGGNSWARFVVFGAKGLIRALRQSR